MRKVLIALVLAAMLAMAGCGGSGASSSKGSSEGGSSSLSAVSTSLAPEGSSALSSVDSKKSASDAFVIAVGDTMLMATFADNSSAEAFADLLAQGPITVSLHDYGSFEKVGPLPQSLPTNDAQITTEPGDVILYQGNQITIYYNTNTWEFTRLGKIEGATTESLLAALGDGDVEVTLSLAEK